MNREIKTKKVGRQKKLTNPCPVIKGETEVMVGGLLGRIGLKRY